jgi:chloramphenicol-sensitive protein RarD
LKNTGQRAGVLYALVAYSCWGLFPLYWKLLAQVPALQILGHRLLWSAVLVLGLVVGQQRWPEFQKLLAQRKSALGLLGSASILAVNWGIYIYGVNSNQVVETSLGYFMNPMVNVLLGVVVLRERLAWGQWLAVALAASGVGYAVAAMGRVPWLALALAVSFGFYGLLRKLIVVPPLLGLALETSWLAPLALIYLLLQPQPYFGQQLAPTLLLLGAGIVTALPLFCFSAAAQRLPLSTMGFFQYLAPSLQLLLGVFLYREPFTRQHIVLFGCIWSALLVYTAVTLGQRRSPEKKTNQPPESDTDR